MRLILASKNVHKIREFRAILKPLSFLDLFSLLDFPSYFPEEEKGDSFKKIAEKKAFHAAKALGEWTLADDSGLIVPALQGEPGIFSNRYAGKDASDKENRQKLLFHMNRLKDQEREAYFECCLSIASPQKIEKTVCATCEGRILSEEKGGGGFGYDALFVKRDYNKTFAEMQEVEKNRISARRKALDKLLSFLESLASRSSSPS